MYLEKFFFFMYLWASLYGCLQLLLRYMHQVFSLLFYQGTLPLLQQEKEVPLQSNSDTSLSFEQMVLEQVKCLLAWLMNWYNREIWFVQQIPQTLQVLVCNLLNWFVYADWAVMQLNQLNPTWIYWIFAIISTFISDELTLVVH